MSHTRPLSAYDAAALGVETSSKAGLLGVNGRTAGGANDAPASEISGVFAYQSYFDDTLLQRAILAQPPNQPIVPSTLQSLDQAGYAIGLHPSSQTPVAIQFKSGAQGGQSTTMILKPGELLRPHGLGGSSRNNPGQFSGFNYGLPFGWLGGGSYRLIVMKTADATVKWIDHVELIFHRQRLQIYALNKAPVPSQATLNYNWPLYFPWPQAIQGANALTQRGQPAIAVQPTRTAMMLRLATLADASTMRCMFVGTDDFAQDAAGAIQLSDVPAAVDVVWGTWTSLAVVNYLSQYPTQMFSGELERFQAPNGSVIAVTSDAELEGQFVDVVRYGRL